MKTIKIWKIVLIALCAIAIVSADASARRPMRENGGKPPLDSPLREMDMRGPRHGMMAPVTEEEEATAISFLRMKDPMQVPRLLELKDRAPRWYAMKIRRILMLEARFGEMAERDSAAYQRNLDMFRLESMADEFAIQHKQSDVDSQREQYRDMLIDTLSRLFELREQEKQFEIERLERRLEHLRRVVEERGDNQQDIVERRADEMLGDRDSLEW